jgi:glucose/arabinose dehydrogenase
MRKAGILACLAAALGALIALPSIASAAPKKAPKFDVLVFSKTAGFRHDSIPTGIARIQQLGAANRFRVQATEDASVFRRTTLRRYEVVVFLSTTGNVLNRSQQDAFEAYIRDGGGFVGIHAAADTEYDWPFYGNLVGAYFKSHPAIQRATIKVADQVHPSTRHLPDRWVRTDEWYDYRANPRGDVHVLASLDESTYQGATMGAEHPIAWCQQFEGGRSWYTGGGHTRQSYGEPAFQRHLLGGIRWAAGEQDGDCRATVDSSFQKVALNDDPGEPMGLAVLPDGRVLHTDRTGEVRLHDPETGLNTLAADLSEQVYQHDEEGVQSIAIDPDFERNRWVYLYHSLPPGTTPEDDPATPDVNEGDAPTTGTPADWARFRGAVRLSRFKLTDAGTLNLRSAQKIIDVPVDRGLCCHVGGHIDFDAQGNLYLSTGDDTNPFQSDGYSPIDERPERNPAFDAQRSSANTNDLRGKVLRIRPKAGGGYTIPAGNLFPQGAPQTRPEIYLMGLRNPFRIAVNRENGDLYVADYSPDADDPDPERGPAGQGKWFIARGPGNYGWPYCATAELPYVDYDFAAEESGEPFDCANPVNDSPHNTGVRRLPPVQQPDVWYSYDESPLFPELGRGGIGPMAGPAYDYDKRSSSRVRWPEYYDGVPLFYEWTRDWVMAMHLDGEGNVFEIDELLPSFTFKGPMDMEFGPDGALYTLEYGKGFFLESPDAQLARIDYVRGGRTPIPEVSAEPTNGPTPLTVEFSSAGTSDPDGDRLTYQWDFDADGDFDSTQASPTFTYEENGVYQATLKVTDRSGRSASASVEVIVGNEAPVVEFVTPVPGQPFQFGDAVPFEVRVTDDQEVDCTQVQVSYILGHDTHGHPLSSTTGCTGQLLTSAQGHEGEDNIRGVFVATYEDDGPNGDGEGSLSGSAEVVLEPTGGGE